MPKQKSKRKKRVTADGIKSSDIKTLLQTGNRKLTGREEQLGKVAVRAQRKVDALEREVADLEIVRAQAETNRKTAQNQLEAATKSFEQRLKEALQQNADLDIAAFRQEFEAELTESKELLKRRRKEETTAKRNKNQKEFEKSEALKVAITALARAQNRAIETAEEIAASNVKKDATLKDIEKFAADKHPSRKRVLDTVIAQNHQGSMARVSKQYNYVIAARETGSLSINRLNQGAKPKPHFILEKSIKKSSVEKGYGEKGGKFVLDIVKSLDLDGFVGSWGNDGKLLGVRIDKMPENILKQIGGYAISPDGNGSYLPVDLSLNDGGEYIRKLKQIPNWQKYLYTGDYDLHEVYKTQGGNRGQISDATQDMADMINRINDQIAIDDPSRRQVVPAKAHVDKSKARNPIHVDNSDYALIQHGPQSTYVTNQIFERIQRGDRDESLAPIVAAVASESNEPLAWVINGKWYVTNNAEEHAIMRGAHSLTPPSTWDPAVMAKIKAGQSNTLSVL